MIFAEGCQAWKPEKVALVRFSQKVAKSETVAFVWFL